MGKKGGGRVRVVQKGPKMPANPMADFAIPPDEELNLPVKPDSGSGYLIWPMGETITMKYDNFSVIYPNYLDSNKTVKLGRRIAAKDAVPEPTVQDLHEALASLNVRHVIQPYKGYSRDSISRWDNPGRVLVDLEGAAENGIVGMGTDGAFDLDEVPDINDDNDKENNGGSGGGKKQLLREIAKVIPKLPNRQKRIEEKAKAAAVEAEKQKKLAIQAEKSAPSKGGGGSGSSGKKKKGKKKK
ncbi:signal recognition particle subunit SRP19/SEC65 family protein [Skeletonema marinoi]|uniref:Signal recognition particle subunit SRP19/SEC65 family protein n=1 Tax=Skeletonema marinoi TaxID=267567 RepID=A0AAD9DFV3_9STRA|nr:signal recognition particle subunit SRP19/SEC65 family protein [Skeletonema marinoi]